MENCRRKPRFLLTLGLIWIWQAAHAAAFVLPPAHPSSTLPRDLLGIGESDEVAPTTTASHDSTHLVFPGGGLFFYWQAGVVTYLREQGYDLQACRFSGASAGALTATLAATGVDYYEATELALKMSKEAGVWDRTGGLQGIWGPLIAAWLDQLLPHDAVHRVGDGRLNLLVTPLPGLGKECIREFQNRDDLIRCNMASVHIPWFLDGQWTATFRDRPYIDGSFLATSEHYVMRGKGSSSPPHVLVLDYKDDPLFRSQGLLDFVSVISPDRVRGLLEDGQRFAQSQEERGSFSCLPR